MNKRIRISIIFLAVFGIIVYASFGLKDALFKLSKTSIGFDTKVSANFLNLFNSYCRNEIVPENTTSYNSRSSIVHLLYKNKYEIKLTKIASKKNFNLIKDVVEFHKRMRGSQPEVYSAFRVNNFELTFNVNSTDSVSKIYLTMEGDSSYSFNKSDTIIYYYSKLRFGSLQFKPGGIYEIALEPKRQFYFLNQTLPTIFMFLKRAGSLYFITMNGKNKDAPLSSDILYKMVQ